MTVENTLHATFLGALGQPSHQLLDGRIRTCYSSSVAMEILARALSDSVRSVALVHPTFDNIADILLGNGLNLLPIREQQVFDDIESFDIPTEADCLFITTPNNPTGRVLNAAALARIADECAARRIILALDTSFRGFDERACFDHYAILEGSTARYVVIEDSGKLWPTLDAKVGLLAYSKNLDLPIDRIYTDILLGVSPFIMALVTSFAADAIDGGLHQLRAEIRERRTAVRDILKDGPGVSFPDADSSISVERLELSEQSATAFWRRLRAEGIDTLPCPPFYWADRSRGDRYLRIALARPADVVAAAASGIKEALIGWRRS